MATQPRLDGLFASVRSRRVSDQIVEQIRAAIFNGALQSGDRLNERELALQFEASRSAVREATRTLELAGLVNVRPGAAGGVYVTQPDSQLVSTAMRTLLHTRCFDVPQIYDARLLIEPGVAERAAMRAAPSDLTLLHESIQAAREAGLDPDCEARAHYEFHLLLAQASKSELLVMLVRSLLDLLDSGPRTAPQPTAVLNRISDAHLAILSAVEHGDPNGARSAAIVHLEELVARSPRRQSIWPDSRRTNSQ